MNWKRWILNTVLILLMTFAYYQTAAAQTPSPDDKGGWIREVSGRIINMNGEATSTEDVQIMLHAWDENNTQKFMLHGELNADDTFLFEEVPLENGLLLSAMVVYKGATYYSEPIKVESENDTLELNIEVYETTNDPAALQIDQMHVIFYFDGSGLGVTEVYILSNLGDRTVSEAVSWNEAGEKATMSYPLPPDATNVRFLTNNDNRFLRSSEGFVDTSPIAPGQQISQVVVSYNLPYTDGGTFSFTPPLPVMQFDILIDASSEVELSASGLVSQGVQTLQDGSRFEFFSGEQLAAGDTVEVELSGEPVVVLSNPASTVAMGATSREPAGRNLAIGGAILGAVLIATGIWWFRSGDQEEGDVSIEEDAELTAEIRLNDVIEKIASLDQAYEEGSISQEEHHQERALLLASAKNLLAAQTGNPVNGGMK